MEQLIPDFYFYIGLAYLPNFANHTSINQLQDRRVDLFYTKDASKIASMSWYI